MTPAIRKALAVIMIVCGVFILGVSALIGPSINTVTGVIILIVGILQLARKNPPGN